MMCSRRWLRSWLATVLALSCLRAWAVPQIEVLAGAFGGTGGLCRES